MILEMFPEIQKLSEKQKLLLISELWAGLLSGADNIRVSDRVLDDAEESVRDLQETPQNARPWEEVKRSIKSSGK